MAAFTVLVTLVLVGTLCSLDTVSVGQTMISRPIVSATLSGALLGRAGDGLVAGALMELFALETMPFGASRYPEWGSAGVVAGAAYAFGGARVPGALAVAVLGGLITGGFGAVSMAWQRRFVARAAESLRGEIAAGSYHAVARLHAAGIASDMVRGAAVTLAGLAVSLLLVVVVLAHWQAAYGASLAWPMIAALAVAIAAVARTARATPGAGWLVAAGLLAGILAMVRR